MYYFLVTYIFRISVVEILYVIVHHCAVLASSVFNDVTFVATNG